MIDQNHLIFNYFYAFSSFFPPKWRKGLQPLAGDISTTTWPMAMIKPFMEIVLQGESNHVKFTLLRWLKKIQMVRPKQPYSTVQLRETKITKGM